MAAEPVEKDGEQICPGAVELSRRRDNLSFSHHVEVATMWVSSRGCGNRPTAAATDEGRWWPAYRHTILGRSELYWLGAEGVSFVDWMTEFVNGGAPGDVYCKECG